MCNQDKRSVPKRTDALHKKGYIQKRTILSRSTKTSKIWITSLAPVEVKDTEITDESEPNRPAIAFSHQVLAGNMEPVPWSDRWTGKDIDYITLGSTIVAIAKTWGVIRICDLKMKLGIIKMRWQMKVFSRTCRFLNHRGIIQYVAAELDGRVFKDCVRFSRELNEQDWVSYHQAGKRQDSWARDANEEGDTMDAAEQTTLGTVIRSLSPWNYDQALPNYVIELARGTGEEKMSNPGLYCMTLGVDFRRYLSSMTSSFANAQAQPTHLKHLQLQTMQVRMGKIASYRYFLPPGDAASGPLESADDQMAEAEGSSLQDMDSSYGFQQSKLHIKDLAMPLSGLCRPRASWHKSAGKTFKALQGQPASQGRSNPRGDQQPSKRIDAKESPSPYTSRSMEAAERPFTVTESSQPIETESAQGASGGTRGGKSQRARGKGRGRGRGNKSAVSGDAKQWKCEKCGGTWKNDVGLKYHVQKSRTACNPNWDPNQGAAKDGRKGKPAQSNTATSAVGDPRGQNGKASLGPETPRRITPAILDMGSKRAGRRNERLGSTANLANRGNYSKKVTIPKKILSVRASNPVEPSPIIQRPDIGLTHNLEVRRAPKQPKSAGGPQVFRGTESFPPSKHEELEVPTSSKDTVAVHDIKVSETPNDQLATPRVLPRAVKRDRIIRLIDELLERNEGIFPGGEPFYQCLAALWQRDHREDIVPFVKEMNLSLKYHSSRGRVAEHWKSFRTEKGRFAQCHVISDPNIDAFSPKAVDMMDKIKALHPRMYLPPSVEDLRLPDEDVEKVRGRRILPDEVAKLSAPVYAAQIAAKREAEELVEEARALKRQKLKLRHYYDGSRGVRLKRRGWKGRRARLTRRTHMLLNQQKADLQFLEPNTRLYEQPTKYSLEEHDDAPLTELPYYLPRNLSPSHSPEPPPWASSPPQYLQAELEGEISFAHEEPEEVPALPFGTIMPATVIHGMNGNWPAIDSHDFERAKSSFTVQGWQPQQEWFAWETIVEEIERRAVARHSHRRYIGKHPLRRHRRFKEMITACLGVEAAWKEFFVRANPGDAGPHNIFVPITSGSQGNEVSPYTVNWPDAQEYKPETGRETGYWTTDETELPSSDDELMIHRSRHGRTGPRGPYRRRRQLLSGLEASVKRVPLSRRRLTALPYSMPRDTEEPETNNGDIPEDPNEILAAIIAIRSLLGGLHKSVDWGLLLQIYPHLELDAIRKFWVSALSGRGAYVKKLTQDFQKNFIIAYENDEIAAIDFDNLQGYDWAALIQWTLQLALNYENVHLPPSKQELDELYSVKPVEVFETEDWREKWYHPHSSVFGRFELATEAPGAIRIKDRGVVVAAADETIDHVYVARSWIRSLCSTDDMKHSPQRIKEKFLTLVNNDGRKAEQVLEKAIDELTKRRIIHKSRRPALGGRPYRLTEFFSSSLAKLAQRNRFSEALAFKEHMDQVFRRGEALPVSYTFDDGTMMALMNMQAHGRIRLDAPDLPHIPYGFEPGNYETRKLAKTHYHFGLEVSPSETYLFNEDIGVLAAAATTRPPLQGQERGELPQWTDFFADEQDTRRWGDVLGGFCFHASTRGPMRLEGMCAAMSPVLEEFEARMIVEWGMATGVLEEWEEGRGTMVGEWWWLAVPWLQRERGGG
ncbi:hypothetical protein N3K66_008411 [Trichothecium roseum]|uniref:Uncharacterized protein n=1 Tax=Trichothecium roseum TaxID=47278 RepID=A0ACC0UQ54_9HYPO|nr:hypothetical protein N3K66_008411 [Trichothecium roseum]